MTNLRLVQAVRLLETFLCESSRAAVTGVTIAVIGSAISTYGSQSEFLFSCEAVAAALITGRFDMGTSLCFR
jgi:hypothetical protein